MCILSWSSQFLQVSLSENCLFLRTDNIHKQIHVAVHIFVTNQGDYCAWQSLNNFWHISDNIFTTFLWIPLFYFNYQSKSKTTEGGVDMTNAGFSPVQVVMPLSLIVVKSKKLLHDCINYKHTCFLFESHLPLYQNHLSLDCLLVLQREQLLQPES